MKRDLWDIIKWTSLWIVRVPKGKVRDSGERLFEEIIAAGFPNLRKDMNVNIKETQ